jgi:hypothetical protein
LENLVLGRGQAFSESTSFSQQCDTTLQQSQTSSQTYVLVSQSIESSRENQFPEPSLLVIDNNKDKVPQPSSSNTEHPQTDEASTSATDSLNQSSSIVEISTQEAPTQENDSRDEPEEGEIASQNERREDQINSELQEGEDGEQSPQEEHEHEDWSDDSTSRFSSEIAENWRSHMETSLEEQLPSPSQVDHRLFAVHNDSDHSMEIRELLNRYIYSNLVL